ncbi:MAG: sugar transferase [Acidimicrobiia bacterium]|nr:sugar transferase [Acidimicrobiia bacterium]
MRRRFLINIAVSDFVSLVVGVVVASMLVFQKPLPWQAVPGIWPSLAALFVGGGVGTYISARSHTRAAPRPTYGRAVWVVGFALATTAATILGTRAYFSRPFLGSVAALWFGLAIAHRWVKRWRPWSQPLVLVTAEKDLAEDLYNAPHTEILDVLDPGGYDVPGRYPEGTVLAVDQRSVLSEETAQFVSAFNRAGRPVDSFIDVYEEHTGRIPIVHLMEGWELTTPWQQTGIYEQFKRPIELVLVAVTSVVWIPLSLLLALLVRIDSPGPAIFRQERVGRYGKSFTLYKFRSMVVNAEVDGPRQTTVGDERLTRMGNIMRKYRVDELPQLWNVLKGDLSLVGPRPEQRIFVDDYAERIPFYTNRHRVRPGVTGWAQVSFGYADDEVATIEKLSYDLYYVKHVSPWLDLQILGKSVWTVLSGFGAQ